ncbi:GNAT family N-acetyltransferase [Umezawaea tangerina]|uniref:RimJ/RimL family protein N-acetyltransferase n=1 Tax=Umezawaea tangerina TaxID=84725 RepID=A0A2T0T3V3_9PSEU|nr:GNAT family protein [Umezawaea tangerina]PRY40309.1 RimJ/RimL family protein N-acetyltransferase [Umezawaea tangerina]
MLNLKALVDKPTLSGDLVRLVPLVAEHAPDLFKGVNDPEVRRLTGTHRVFTFEEVERHAATRAEQTDRVDLTVLRAVDGKVLGDIVLNDLDADNLSMGFRIALVAEQGRGYGTEAIRLLLRYAFDVVGLHRVELEVFDFNPRAIASYRKCGFVEEGRARDALLWEGEWHDALLMAVVSTDNI